MKICVLCMSCNHDIYKYQEMVARNTWISHLKEENIDVFIYTSGKYNVVDIKNNKIYCNIKDDLIHTYEKTICALSQLSLDNYDYIVRTNLTTYINAKLLKLYCQFLQENNYDISNGCLCIKDELIHYRGNSLIMNRKVAEYLKNNIYKNIECQQDDFVFQNIFKNIPYLKIHSVPFRYYCKNKKEYFIDHPQTIKEINKENCEGIVFISYRIKIELNNSSIDNISSSRYIELGRCYEIDSIYNKLENNSLNDNFNIIMNINNWQFIKYNYIIQENSKITIS